MPAKRDAAVGTGAALVARMEPEPEPDEEVEPEELDDDPCGGRPMTTPPAAMPAGGRWTPRIAGRAGAAAGAGVDLAARDSEGRLFAIATGSGFSA